MSDIKFSVLTPLLFLLLGLGQGGLWWRWRSHRELAWMGLSLCALSAAMTVQMLTRGWPLWLHVLSFSALYMLSTSAAGQVLALRVRVRMPWSLAAALALVIVALQLWYSLIAPSLLARVLGLSVLGLCLMGLPLLQWRRMQPRNAADRLLCGLYVLCIVSHIARTLLQSHHTQGIASAQFMETAFWLMLHVFAMFTGMSLAGCLFFAVLHDVLEQLQVDRNTDALTDVLNRRGWQAHLARLEDLHAQQPVPDCALLLADIDHFKQINDCLGHAAGDQVLQQVAQLFKQQVRGQDAVCRHGGEEFVVLLVGADMQIAHQVAERIRQRIQKAALAVVGGQPLTISIGLAPLKGLAPQDVAQALVLADMQLYAAKHGGRNQVVMADEPVEPAYCSA